MVLNNYNSLKCQMVYTLKGHSISPSLRPGVSVALQYEWEKWLICHCSFLSFLISALPQTEHVCGCIVHVLCNSLEYTIRRIQNSLDLVSYVCMI
jgi:hypothetical protein